jgi:FkbM family methyltransferase
VSLNATAVVSALREPILRAITRRTGMPRTVNGLSVRVASTARAVFSGDYDRPVADYLRSRIQPGSEVWSVGANVGVYTLQFASWVGPAGCVVAFEPNPRAARLLRENVRLNGLSERVEIVECAIGDHRGHVDLFIEGASGMARAGRPNPMLAEPESVRVPVTTLDLFRAARGTSPSWIMMDIEGWEIAALRGAGTLFDTTRFAVELHPSAWAWSGHNRTELERLLDDAGLDIVPLIGQLDPLNEHGQVALERRPMPCQR